jgi:hypothetical protein
LLQAQAHGRRAGSELLVFFQGAVERVRQPGPQLAILVAQAYEFWRQVVTGGARALGVRDSLLDPGGMVVDGLAGAAVGLGLVGDGAVRAEDLAAALPIQARTDSLAMGVYPDACASLQLDTQLTYTPILVGSWSKNLANCQVDLSEKRLI